MEELPLLPDEAVLPVEVLLLLTPELVAGEAVLEVAAAPRPTVALARPRDDWTLYGTAVAQVVCTQTSAPANPASQANPFIKILSQTAGIPSRSDTNTFLQN